MYTAEAILNMNSPGDLFSNDQAKIKAEYRRLMKQWHPDINKDPAADKVIKKVNDLYQAGVDMIKAGNWTKTNFVQFRTLNHKKIGITYLKEHLFELGKMYICNQSVIYLVEKKHKTYYDNYVQRVSQFRFKNDDMKREFMKYLPHIQDQFETEDYYALKVSKPADVFSLRDILTHFKGNVPDRHMAWILSSLYNMACYLFYNDLTHNGLNIDAYFISPAFHSGMLLGGWWYTVKNKEPLIGAPKDVFNIMTPKVKSDKKGHYVTDLDSIRQIGRELVGDKFGTRLLSSTTIPKPVVDWLLGGSVKAPFEEYGAWGDVLNRGYGKRTFVELKVESNDLYVKN